MKNEELKLIKRVKHYKTDARISTEDFRKYAEKFESEILRGISTLTILSIINENPEGVYGYQLLQELKEKTQDKLVLEEGTLYPMLKKLERDGIVERKEMRIGGRPRNYYFMTDYGTEIFNHLLGFYVKLMEAIGHMFELEVSIEEEKYIYCPNCSNRIDIEDKKKRYCIICGYNIQDRIQYEGGNDNEL